MTAISEHETQEAVREVMVRLTEAWERGDGDAYASVFSEDAQYVNAPGERVHGRKSIAESHQAIFDTFFKETKLGRSYPYSLRRIAPEVVLVEAAGAVLFPGENENNVAPNGLMTLVLARQDNAWRIVSFQNTPTGRWRTFKLLRRYLLSRFSVFRAKRHVGQAA